MRTHAYMRKLLKIILYILKDANIKQNIYKFLNIIFINIDLY